MSATNEPLRVLITADTASKRFGGESTLPIQYFRLLRARGIEAWLLVHGRTRNELERAFPADADRLHFIDDAAIHRLLTEWGHRLPARIAHATTDMGTRLLTAVARQQVARRLVIRHDINVVHEPIPVSPREPSLCYGFGAAVVLGPLNGGMSFPPGFRQLVPRHEEVFINTARAASQALHYIFPGKLQADTLVVANARTRSALPSGLRGNVVELVENAIDPAAWIPRNRAPSSGEFRLLYVGRLVNWKGVQLLIRALRRVRIPARIHLTIVGDGVERDYLERLTRDLQLTDNISFLGWLTQDQVQVQMTECDALVLPSVFESGGAVVLEAMALERPVLAANWGGPADYVTQDTGILVQPTGEEDFVAGLASGIERLACSPELRRQMGEAGRRRVIQSFSWEGKLDRMLDIYAEAILRHREVKGRSTLPRRPTRAPRKVTRRGKKL